MKVNYSLLVKLMLIGLFLSAGAIGSVSAVSNLSISKSGVITAPENITWTIKVTNYNETKVAVNVTEYIPTGCVVVDNSTTNGTYENEKWLFSIDSTPGANQTLTLNMICDVNLTCNTTRMIENVANITAPDVPAGNKTARANVTLKGRDCQPVTVKPETLNIKQVNVQGNGKGGVITVFITVGEAFNKTDILDDSFITCNDADAEKILFSEKDNGTIIAKFRRGDLNVTADEGMTEISCYGEINTPAGKYIIEGNDTVRAIHADDSGKQTSLLDRILRFLGIQTSEGEDEISADVISPDSLEGIKNLGQFKKQISETPTVTPEGEEEENEVSPVPTERGKGKSKGLEVVPTPTPDEENGKGRGQGRPTDENGGKGKD